MAHIFLYSSNLFRVVDKYKFVVSAKNQKRFEKPNIGSDVIYSQNNIRKKTSNHIYISVVF